MTLGICNFLKFILAPLILISLFGYIYQQKQIVGIDNRFSEVWRE